MNWGDEAVICPFFKDMTSEAIRCENVFSCSVINDFGSKNLKREHAERYCCTFNYKKCLLAKMLLEKYAAEDVREKGERYTELYKTAQKKGVMPRERNENATRIFLL